MNKKFAAIACIAAVMLISGCDPSSGDSVIVQNVVTAIKTEPAVSETMSEETTVTLHYDGSEDIYSEEEPATETEIETETEAEPETKTEPQRLSDGEARALVREMLSGAMYVNSVILPGALTADTSSVFTDENGAKYSPVINENFSTVQELKEYILSFLTQDYYDAYLNGVSLEELIFGGASPLYADFGGRLCINYASVGISLTYQWNYAGISFFENNEKLIEANLSGTSSYGDSCKCIVNLTLEDSGWRVNGVLID